MAPDTLRSALAMQRKAFLTGGYPSISERKDRLDRLIAMLLRFDTEIVETLSDDFGGRSRFSTRVGDIVGGINAVRFNQDHLAEWMAPIPIPMPPPMAAAGARAELRCEPLGVVGVFVPWNGPVLLSCLAAAGVMAAGNRMMLKVPEHTPRTSALIARMFGEYFDRSELVVVEGDATVGAAFAHLPFDHLLFTGSAGVARQVMKSAAENLVPVTLELGGKNPVLIGRSANMASTIARLATGKMASGGQVCVSPDYAFVPEGTTASFVEAMAKQAVRLYPTLIGNDDYTATANPQHYERLRALLDDARAKGAEITEVCPDGDATWQGGHRKFPLCLLTGVTPDMRVMQEEIFGPMLCVLEYTDIDEALAFVASRPHPLSAYYFGADAEEEARVVQGIQAGNMVVNDVRCQLFFEQLPFGGVGSSGMGRYRGYEGFRTFSNLKTVVYQMTDDRALALQRPPFDESSRVALANQVAALQKISLPTTATGRQGV